MSRVIRRQGTKVEWFAALHLVGKFAKSHCSIPEVFGIEVHTPAGGVVYNHLGIVSAAFIQRRLLRSIRTLRSSPTWSTICSILQVSRQGPMLRSAITTGNPSAMIFSKHSLESTLVRLMGLTSAHWVESLSALRSLSGGTCTISPLCENLKPKSSATDGSRPGLGSLSVYRCFVPNVEVSVPPNIGE